MRSARGLARGHTGWLGRETLLPVGGTDRARLGRGCRALRSNHRHSRHHLSDGLVPAQSPGWMTCRSHPTAALSGFPWSRIQRLQDKQTEARLSRQRSHRPAPCSEPGIPQITASSERKGLSFPGVRELGEPDSTGNGGRAELDREALARTQGEPRPRRAVLSLSSHWLPSHHLPACAGGFVSGRKCCAAPCTPILGTSVSFLWLYPFTQMPHDAPQRAETWWARSPGPRGGQK